MILAAIAAELFKGGRQLLAYQIANRETVISDNRPGVEICRSYLASCLRQARMSARGVWIIE
jgi:hypothetical protein